MDTRRKIIQADEASPVDDRTVVWIGYFDPLLADHARRLGEISREGERIVAVVADPAEPLLALGARVELVAGLGAICSVVEAGEQVDSVLKDLASKAVIDDRSRDAETTRRLSDHVISRHEIAQ